MTQNQLSQGDEKESVRIVMNHGRLKLVRDKKIVKGGTDDTDKMKTKNELENLESELKYFIGSENIYEHWMSKNLKYTDGIRYLCEKIGGYWLMDIIMSYNKCDLKTQRCPFQMWILTIKNGKGDIIMREDTNTPVIVKHDILATDLPNVTLKLYCCDGTLMLPTEY